MSTIDKELDQESKERLLDASKSLDHSNEGHWTNGGLPDCNALSQLSGMKVTRALANAVLPNIKREDLSVTSYNNCGLRLGWRKRT